MERITCNCCGIEEISSPIEIEELDMVVDEMSHCADCNTYECEACARQYGWPSCRCGIDEVARDLVETGHFDPLKNMTGKGIGDE